MPTQAVSWMTILIIFTSRKRSYHCCIKYLQVLLFSFPVLVYMVWFLLWQCNEQKKLAFAKCLVQVLPSIMYLFSKEFTLLIVIAFIIAAPLAWYFTNNWLQNFHYRIQIGIGVFVLAVLISVVIALITVGYKSLRAAIANPVKSLRTE